MDPIRQKGLMDLPGCVHIAVRLMREAFGGTDVKIVGDKLRRGPKTEAYPIGRLGIDITIMGIPKFLGVESEAEEIAIWPSLAEEYVYKVLKPYLDKYAHNNNDKRSKKGIDSNT